MNGGTDGDVGEYNGEGTGKVSGKGGSGKVGIDG